MPKPRAGRIVKKLADAVLRFNVKARRMGEGDRGLAPATCCAKAARRTAKELAFALTYGLCRSIGDVDHALIRSASTASRG
jgi:hypothetical protein